MALARRQRSPSRSESPKPITAKGGLGVPEAVRGGLRDCRVADTPVVAAMNRGKMDMWLPSSHRRPCCQRIREGLGSAEKRP